MHYQTNIIDFLPDATFAIDKEKSVIAWNRAMEEMTGIKKEDMLGKVDYSIPFYGTKRPLLIDLVLEPEEVVKKFYRTVIKKDNTIYVEGFVPRMRKGKGAYLWGIASHLLDNKGNVVGAVESMRDITENRQLQEALQESEDRYRSLVENATDIVLWTDNEGYLTLVNPALLRITGYKEGEIIGKHYKILVRSDMRDDATMFFGRQFVTGIENTYSEYPISSKDGQEFWFGQNTQLIKEDKHIVGFQVVARDITDRKRAEEALRESELKYRTLVESTHDFVFMVDRRGLFTYVNPNFEKVTGYSLAELQGHPFTKVITPQERETIIDRFKKDVRGFPSLPYETELVDKVGEKVVVEFLASNLFDSRGNVTGRFGVGRDITKRKEMEALLKDSEKRYRELSIIDDLTQLYNCRHFYTQLRMEIDRTDRYGQPLTLLLLDLDDFKRFNDTYGHVEGDRVLSRLGQVVKRCLRQADSAYRYGGEEFTILLPMTTNKDAAVIAERIRAEFKKEKFSPGSGKNVHMTVSIGHGQYQPQEDIKDYVRRVDQFMYRAKKNGKDRICSNL